MYSTQFVILSGLTMALLRSQGIFLLLILINLIARFFVVLVAPLITSWVVGAINAQLGLSIDATKIVLGRYGSSTVMEVTSYILLVFVAVAVFFS